MVKGVKTAYSRAKESYHASSILVQSMSKPESRMTTIEKMEASKKELEQLKKELALIMISCLIFYRLPELL